MFRALCAHHKEFNIVLYSIWYHHTVGGRPVHRLTEDGQQNIKKIEYLVSGITLINKFSIISVFYFLCFADRTSQYSLSN